MSRIQAVFKALQAQGRKGLIPYVTAGDPYPDAMVDLMLAMATAGADVIELGVPFSDPMADGPVDQRAAERALAKGIGMPQVSTTSCFSLSNDTTPVVLMGYANPIERYDHAAAEARSDVMRKPMASTASWSSATHLKNAKPLLRNSRRMGSTRSSCWRRPPPSSA